MPQDKFLYLLLILAASHVALELDQELELLDQELELLELDSEELELDNELELLELELLDDSLELDELLLLELEEDSLLKLVAQITHPSLTTKFLNRPFSTYPDVIST